MESGCGNGKDYGKGIYSSDNNYNNYSNYYFNDSLAMGMARIMETETTADRISASYLREIVSPCRTSVHARRRPSPTARPLAVRNVVVIIKQLLLLLLGW